MIKAIVAVDKKWGIGKNNGLLFSIPEDMKFFRQKTSGKVVCMGYNTLLSFPDGKPLKNRTNIVLCSDGTPHVEGCIIVNTLSQLFEKLHDYDGQEIYVTKVDADGGATVFFENLDEKDNWQLTYESEPVQTNGYTIRFTTYKNTDVRQY